MQNYIRLFKQMYMDAYGYIRIVREKFRPSKTKQNKLEETWRQQLVPCKYSCNSCILTSSSILFKNTWTYTLSFALHTRLHIQERTQKHGHILDLTHLRTTMYKNTHISHTNTHICCNHQNKWYKMATTIWLGKLDCVKNYSLHYGYDYLCIWYTKIMKMLVNENSDENWIYRTEVLNKLQNIRT